MAERGCLNGSRCELFEAVYWTVQGRRSYQLTTVRTLPVNMLQQQRDAFVKSSCKCACCSTVAYISLGFVGHAAGQ